MPEVRLNRITGDWVIIATERAKRPHEFIQKKEKKELSGYAETCPFCAGNENQTPPETMRLAGSDGKWLVRCVPNKYSALSTEGIIIKKKTDFKQYISGVGLHEVIIEAPEHNKNMALLPLSHIEQILKAYKQRQLAFYEDPRVEHVIIFKNHGATAGTSLEHPHSQIVGTPVFPGQVMTRLEGAMRNYYYVDYRECIYCTYMNGEVKDGERIISENDSFVAFVPYAALSPFHTWIFPKRHSGCFAQITDKELFKLAEILRDILLRLYVGLENPDYNYVLRSLSIQGAETKYFHWYISVVPRLTQAAGFELGTGMYINTSLPEESAKFLREVDIWNRSSFQSGH